MATQTTKKQTTPPPARPHGVRPRHDPSSWGNGEANEEEPDVLTDDPLIYHDVRPVLPAPTEAQDRDPDDEHRERGQGERSPEDRPDADLASGSSSALAGERGPDEGDHPDHGLRQGRSHGREYAADRPLAQVQALAQDLDGVGKYKGGPQDRPQGEN